MKLDKLTRQLNRTWKPELLHRCIYMNMVKIYNFQRGDKYGDLFGEVLKSKLLARDFIGPAAAVPQLVVRNVDMVLLLGCFKH